MDTHPPIVDCTVGSSLTFSNQGENRTCHSHCSSGVWLPSAPLLARSRANHSLTSLTQATPETSEEIQQGPRNLTVVLGFLSPATRRPQCTVWALRGQVFVTQNKVHYLLRFEINATKLKGNEVPGQHLPSVHTPPNSGPTPLSPGSVRTILYLRHKSLDAG